MYEHFKPAIETVVSKRLIGFLGKNLYINQTVNINKTYGVIHNMSKVRHQYII